jgi:Concanavalin A-like lectin/glucanases superfamily
LWPAAKAPQRGHILFLTSGTTPNLRHQASGGGTVTITSSVAIVNDSTWSTIVGTWRPGRLELYVDGWSRASSTAAATNTSASFGIYRWGWGFSTSQDFNGDIALIACFASSGPPPWCGGGTPISAGAEGQEGGEPPPLAGAGVVICLMG